MKPTQPNKEPTTLVGIGNIPVPECKIPRHRFGVYVEGVLKTVRRAGEFTDMTFDAIPFTVTMHTKEVPEWVETGNTIQISAGPGGMFTIKLLKIMPDYTIEHDNLYAVIKTKDGRTLATIPVDQAKTFADVESAIFEQNKGNGNVDECIEATNYFLIHGIKAQ